jgi:electron transfer flavoprotein alpha subunit
MNTLVLVEEDQNSVRNSSLSAITFARSVADHSSGSVTALLLGADLTAVADDAARYAPVIVADHDLLENPLADRWAAVIARLVTDRKFDFLVAASSTLSKDVVARAAGLLGGAMASDVVGHQWDGDQLQLQRPIFAGAVVATIVLKGHPLIVTVRSSAYAPALPLSEPNNIEHHAINVAELPAGSEFESLDSNASGRPDVTEARIVVSGGRAIKSSQDFEDIVGKLADAVGGATGSSRALVDAGITPNELQVGQTGKVVAPDLYIALGISGAVQHLAGMKNSKVIVAVNTDVDAPMLEMADYALIGDIYEVVPELIEKLHAS